jgi:hypothetical protein
MSPLAELPFWLLDAGLGAVGGLLGWLATWSLRKSNPRAARVGVVVAVVVAGTVSRQFVHPYARRLTMSRALAETGRRLYGSDRAAQLNVEVYLPLIEDPALGPRLQRSGPTKQGFEELTRDGLARLEGAELEALFEVKRAMAAKSPEMCAELWTGKLEQDVLFDAIKKVTFPQQRTWITLSGRAATLELHASAPPAPMSAAARDADFAQIMAKMTPEQSAAFLKAAQHPDTATSADACGAFGAFSAALKLVDAPTRQRALRAVNNPELVKS